MVPETYRRLIGSALNPAIVGKALERQRGCVDILAGGRCQRRRHPRLVECRLARALLWIDSHELVAALRLPPVPEDVGAVDPVWLVTQVAHELLQPVVGNREGETIPPEQVVVRRGRHYVLPNLAASNAQKSPQAT